MKVLILSLVLILIETEAVENAAERYVTCDHTEESKSTVKIKNDAQIILQKAGISTGFPNIEGSLGIVGGLSESIGPLYFTAMSAFRVGMSDVQIFTTFDGEGLIMQKSNPNLKVHRFMETKTSQTQNIRSILMRYLKTFNVIILGPGLKKTAHNVNIVIPEITRFCKQEKIALIVDLDDWFLMNSTINQFTKFPESGIVIVPNHREFEKIYEVMKKPNSDGQKIELDEKRFGPNVHILRKACLDRGISTNENASWLSKEIGSSKRTTGQGNLLTGAVGAYYTWALQNVKDQGLGPMYKAAVATYAASTRIRECTRRTDKEENKGMITSDILNKLAKIFK